jgi:hypothetical protein
MTLLTEFGPDIWVGEGPVVPFLHFPYPTRMVVMRLADGWRGVLARIDGIVAPRPGAPRELRWSFLFHRWQARAALERILAWPIERVIVAHGNVVTADAAAFVRKAFAWLL